LTVGIIISIFLHGKKYLKTIIPIIAGLIIVITITSPDVLTRYTRWAEIEWKGEYEGSRMAIWRAAGRMIADYPIFGVGPGNFESNYETYRDEKSRRIYTGAHNDVLNVAAIAGLPAAVFYLSFWVLIIHKTIILLRRKIVKEIARGVVLGAMMASILFFLSSIVLTAFSDGEIRLLLMAFWGLILAAETMVKRSLSSAETIEKA
jgi:O-antigen ligase